MLVYTIIKRAKYIPFVFPLMVRLSLLVRLARVSPVRDLRAFHQLFWWRVYFYVLATPLAQSQRRWVLSCDAILTLSPLSLFRRLFSFSSFESLDADSFGCVEVRSYILVTLNPSRAVRSVSFLIPWAAVLVRFQNRILLIFLLQQASWQTPIDSVTREFVMTRLVRSSIKQVN